jgi:hypothetical protein
MAHGQDYPGIENDRYSNMMGFSSAARPMARLKVGMRVARSS